MHLLLKLPANSSLPLYKRVSDALRDVIIDGTLKPGQALPSSRELAESLNISRLTVGRSYEDLSGQGFITILHRGKTFVCKDVAARISGKCVAREYEGFEPRLSQYGLRVMNAPINNVPVSDLCGAPLMDELPVSRWKQCLNSAVREVGTGAMAESDPMGYRPLREALNGLLSRSRSIRCSVENIVVHARTAGGADLLCRLLFEEGDVVAVEDPGSELVRNSFVTHGLSVHGVPVDSSGIRVDALKALDVPLRLVYVTPSRHDPSATPMSLPRRQELIEWAAANEVFILEDDFDCEFRYGERPMPSLQSLDKHGVVIYRYNFWKAMFPLIRLSMNVLPPALVPIFQQANQLLYRDVPLLEQCAFAEFITRGYFERHVQERHKSYSKRRALLILELRRVFGKTISISEQTGGTAATIVFDPSLVEERIDQAAEAAGLPLLSTQVKYINVPRPINEFTVNFANLRDDEIAPTIRRFADLLADISSEPPLT